MRPRSNSPRSPGATVSAIAGAAHALDRIADPREAFSLARTHPAEAALARGWLTLALAALIGAGLFSILLVLARTPFVAQLVPGVDFFHVALVVHVDLSVLVWFVAGAGLMWSLDGSGRWHDAGWIALGLVGCGTLALALAPFIAPAAPVMANYVPVLESAPFLYGLVLIGLGFALATVRMIAAGRRGASVAAGSAALGFGLRAAAIAALVALGALAWSWLDVPRALEGKAYYELVFWGPGHVVQFTWTLLMLVAWAWVADHVGAPLALSPRVLAVVFAIGLAAVFATPFIYWHWPVPSVEHHKMMTWLMRFGGGLAILPMVLALGIALGRADRRPRAARIATRPARRALVASLALFAIGGGIGFLIKGSDVRIPAHYHGSIVGVTLALMAIVYVVLPRLGYASARGRLADWQPVLYGAGQLAHILGLVWSGGYGVQRKVAGSEQVLRTTQEVLGMGLMGLGGLVAIAGGMAFIVVVARAMLAGRDRAGASR